MNGLGLCPFQILLSLVKLLGEALVLKELLAGMGSLHFIVLPFISLLGFQRENVTKNEQAIEYS